ncbi:YopX family protein [Bacillus sonorensis]|uniref:YopX family protein n=1 Tax=Bacillus sonorensis TaxID=119858 RepID=UPI003D1CD5F2
MREIKFRAWSNKYQHMFRVREITQDRNGYTHGTIDEEFENEFEPEFDTPFAWVGRVDFTKSPDGEQSGLFQDPDEEPFYLMQYTGLKDKNRKEIYEGDIIHCVHWFFDGNEIEEHFTASVGFRDGSFTLENINSRYYSDYTFEENGKGICWIGDINYCDEDYEIIGNIYQNPDLLLEATE